MSDLTSSLETVRSTIVTNLTSKGVSCSTTENLNDLIAKTNTVKTPVTTTLTLQDTYPNTLEGLMTCLRDKFRINLSKQGVETSSTAGLTTLADSINLIKQDTVLTLTSDKTSVSTGETVTLTATLVDVNGNPVSGATVVFMEGSSTLYSGITTSAGTVSYNYSSSNGGTKILQCVFNGNSSYNSSNSSTSNITVINYIINDTCSTNGLSNYGSVMKYESYTGATITYDSTVKAYEITTTNDNAKLLPIPILKNKDNFTLTVDIMGIDMKIMGIGYMSTEGTGKCYGSYNGYTFTFSEYNNNSWNGISNSGGSYSNNVWYTVKLIKTGTTLKFSVVDSSNTVLNSATLTNITSNYIGICFGYSTSTSSYFRNVKAY